MPTPFNTTSEGPARGGAAVVPSDANDLAREARALYIGVTGDVVLDTPDGATLTFKAAPVGILSVSAKRVRATGTTATNIIALY